MLVRDIIDIDSTYEDFEALSDNDELKTDKKKLKKDKEKINNSEKDDSAKKEEVAGSEDDEFNVSLAKMEEEIKPKIINILESLKKITQSSKSTKLKNLNVC